jgi:hypothetical protein
MVVKEVELSFSVFMFVGCDGEEDVKDCGGEFYGRVGENFQVNFVKDVRRFRRYAVAPRRDSFRLRNFHRK